jgi:hypothetical protein
MIIKSKLKIYVLIVIIIWFCYVIILLLKNNIKEVIYNI